MHLCRSALIAAACFATTALALPRRHVRPTSYSVVNVDGSQPASAYPTTVIETTTEKLQQTVAPDTVTVHASPPTVTVDAQPNTLSVTPTPYGSNAPYAPASSVAPAYSSPCPDDIAPASSSMPPVGSAYPAVATFQAVSASPSSAATYDDGMWHTTYTMRSSSTKVYNNGMWSSTYAEKRGETMAPYPSASTPAYGTGGYYPLKPTGAVGYYPSSAPPYGTGAYVYPSLQPTGYVSSSSSAYVA